MTAVTATRATTWGVRKIVTPTRATTWTDRTPVSDTRSTTWVVRKILVVTRAFSWRALTSRSTSRATSWGTLTFTIVNRATYWNILGGMTTTETFWSVDGVSLQTLAFNIVTLGGDRLAPPPVRGENLLVPAMPGRRWLPKVVDQNVITLGMWVIGAKEDGSMPTTQSGLRQFTDNWRKLRAMLWTPDRQVALSKRFWVDGVLKTATAQAQFSSGLAPTMNGPARAAFTVDLTLADPYFYGPEIITNLSTGAQTVTIAGDGKTRAVKFHVVGARKNVKIRNNTLNVDVEYHRDLSAGDVLDVDVMQYTSLTDPAGAAPYDTVGSIRHTGSEFWFLLQPGANIVTVSSDSGIGAVTMIHREVWL